MPVAAVEMSLEVGGTPVYPTSLRWIQGICDPCDSLEVQTTDLSLKDTSPFTEVTLTIGDSSYLGYAKGAIVNLPTGLVTILAKDAVVKAQDWYELGNLVLGVYVPVQAYPLADVSEWFAYWCERMDIPYEPASLTGRVVPEEKSWQFLNGTDILRELTSYAGQGYQVKADENGVLHLNKYSNVPNSGDLPDSIHTERLVSDEWVRNEAIIYWIAGVVDLVNPGAAIPPAFFRRRAILSSVYIQDAATAYQLAASLLNFYSDYLDAWTITAIDLDVIFKPGIALGNKLLISNITTFIQGQGLVQLLTFDRFCPNMWGMNSIPSLEDMLRNAYASTLVYHALESTAAGISPFTIAPQQENYEVLGVFVYTKTPNVPVFVGIYEDGVALAGTSLVLVSSTLGMFTFYQNVTLLAGHFYHLYASADDMAGVRVGWKYRRFTPS